MVCVILFYLHVVLVINSAFCVSGSHIYKCCISECISPLDPCFLAGSTYSVLSTMPSDSESSSSLSSVGMFAHQRCFLKHVSYLVRVVRLQTHHNSQHCCFLSCGEMFVLTKTQRSGSHSFISPLNLTTWAVKLCQCLPHSSRKFALFAFP